MDLLIVVPPQDHAWLRYTLPTTQRALHPVRTYLLSFFTEELEALFPECTVVSLNRLPFTYDDVVSATSPPHAWTYFVQLARLYASDVLSLERTVVCLDSDAAVLQPLPPGLGTRHGTNPYVFSHIHTLYPAMRKELPQSADVPYYMVHPERLQSMHVEVSTANQHDPFWRLYLAAIPPYSGNKGASDKELYANWEARTQRTTCVPVVWKRLANYAEVTPLMADPKGVHVVTCPYTPFQPSTWTRIQRWLGGTSATLPVPPAALQGLTPGTVVHYGTPDLTPWEGWTYIGVTTDVYVEALPTGTLAVCTEFLPRLCYAHALTFLLRLRRNGYTTILFVDFVPHATPRINVDLPTGDWRVVWWDLPPYNVWGVREHGRVPMDGGTLYVHILEVSPSETGRRI